MNLGIDVRWLHEAYENAPRYASDDEEMPIPGPADGSAGNLGGVGRYLEEMLPRLAARLPDACCVLGILEGHEPPVCLHALWPGARTVGLTPRWRPAGGAMGLLARIPALWVERATRAALAPLRLDVFVSSQQLVVPSPSWARHHAVVCHDLAFIQHPALFFPSGRVPASYRAHYVRLAKAEHHLAVSQRTAEALTSVLGVPRSRITPTPEGVSPQLGVDGPAFAPGWPYALCVGSAGPGKNVPMVLEGWHRARRQWKDVHLVLVGASRERFRELRSAMDPHDVPAVHRAAPVGYAQLGGLYRGATMLLIPSLVEGFGLPAFEAMACGCPVITATDTPMADMAGDAALVVDPHSPDMLAEAIVGLRADPALRRRLIAEGRRIAATYTWDRTADLTADAIRRLAAGGARG
ncbi:glycosyltransferase family 4 protein [Candidatus Fermentibacteria bacterium]|nr:glycosyltransferase family 4 protein [Candidatus Fermentibacteria bacterium]